MAENNELFEALTNAMTNVSDAMDFLYEYEEFDDLYDLLDNAYSAMFPVYYKYWSVDASEN